MCDPVVRAHNCVDRQNELVICGTTIGQQKYGKQLMYLSGETLTSVARRNTVVIVDGTGIGI